VRTPPTRDPRDCAHDPGSAEATELLEDGYDDEEGDEEHLHLDLDPGERECPA
jgi:hypothetical protein